MSPAGFLQRYGIRSIRLSADGDIAETEASRVDVGFDGGCRVTFKLLQGQAARAHRFVRLLEAGRAPSLTAAGEALDEAGREAWLRCLLDAIRDRVAKVQREQSILNIQPVGRRFLLHGRTRFEVLADDGDGRLTIRIRREHGVSEAQMAANDLLDGLYAGIIEAEKPGSG